MEEAKNFKVSSFPDVKEFQLKDDYAFLLNACDGIWDCYTNPEVVLKTSSLLGKLQKKYKKKFKLSQVIENLMDNALSDDRLSAIGTDNMTCILV